MGKASIHPLKTESATMDNASFSSYGNSTTELATSEKRTECSNNNITEIQRKPGNNKKTYSSPWYRREDVLLWGAGIVFILVVMGMIAAVGDARGWKADSSFDHNETQTSIDRFQPEPWEDEPGVRGRQGYDRVARWYYWKLKPELQSFSTHIFPWLGYTLHLLLIWGVTYYAQMKKAQEAAGTSRYSTNLNNYNYIAFGLNAIFHLLHFICTHVTYDGLAQDVSMSTSQASVTMALCLVILLEYKERGIFFGWPTTRDTGKISKKLRWDYAPINIIRRYHGYAIGWAAIYTCWYHPMENTVGHLMGFFYTFIIMLQGSLMYTKLHVNKYWRLALEAWVIVHSGVIAAQTGGEEQEGTRLWPRFVFGFSLALVITQIFSLPFWPRLPVWTRFLPLAVYSAVTLWAYSWIPDENGNPWTRLPEIFTVPSSYYIFFVVGWVLLRLWLWLEKKLNNGKNLNASQAPLSALKQTLCLLAVVWAYGVNTALAIACEYMDWIAGLVVLMLVFVTIFLFSVTVSFMFLRRAVPRRLLQNNPASQSPDQETAVEDRKMDIEINYASDKTEEQVSGNVRTENGVANGGISNGVEPANQTKF